MKKAMQPSPDVPRELSRKLRELVVAHEPTNQRDLAEAIGINTMTWNMAIRGKSTPTLAAAIKIANYFQVSLDELVNRERPKPKRKPARKAAS